MKSKTMSTFLRLAPLAICTLLTASACGTKSFVAHKASDVQVTITAGPDDKTAPLPISFDPTKLQSFTLHLEVHDLSGNVDKTFTGESAWLRLSVTPGTIVTTAGPTGAGDPIVAGPNVHVTDGVADGVVVNVVGAYGDTRVVAQDAGYVPAQPGKIAQCADGVDNDHNGFVDYPQDPNCAFLNDDAEAAINGAYGTSPPIHFAFPRIHDVQGPGSTPFSGKQVELVGVDPVKMYVTAITKDGMYVGDVETDLDPKARHGFNNIFVYNFNPPPGIHICDRLSLLDGNVSVFGGAIQLGTAAWNVLPWLNDKDSGVCQLPDFVEISDTIASDPALTQPLQGGLVRVKNPMLGVNFGSAKAPGGKPAENASNCDLNGDGVAGCLTTKGGYRADEKACCDLCNNDPDCTEWNDYTGHGQVKMKFGASNALLYFKFSLVPNFDPLNFKGPGKFAEVRGSLTTFVIPKPLPSYAVQPRCGDDVVLVGQDAATIRDVAHACICYRTEPDAECTF